MKSTLVTWLFGLAAWLPLRILHRLGSALGWLAYLLSGKYAERLRENLRNAHPGISEAEFQKLLHTNTREMGKSLCELPWIWRRPLDEVLRGVQTVHGLEYLTGARKRGQGIIVLTPHLGSFEIVGQYLAAQMPMTCMYRVPKLLWLDGVMRNGRERGQMKLARADVGGVRSLLKALKRGEAIGLLPDQVPGNGEGEWALFFGRPAYTMTLVGRLADASGATVLLSYGERLPHGEGFVIHISPLDFVLDVPVAKQLNAALEEVIRACPAQYLWSYNRYKIPSGAPPPDAIKEQ
jgi:KDO2-lipid IV(A) lauroyltransferase